MAFSLPVFNLVCNIYTGPWLTKVLRVSDVPCNLAWGRRISAKFSFSQPTESGNSLNASMTLLLNPGTDIRSRPLYPVADIVEVPSGTGRWYIVFFVDDLGKGFDNEHRGAELAQLSDQMGGGEFDGSQWPTPMP